MPVVPQFQMKSKMGFNLQKSTKPAVLDIKMEAEDCTLPDGSLTNIKKEIDTSCVKVELDAEPCNVTDNVAQFCNSRTRPDNKGAISQLFIIPPTNSVTRSNSTKNSKANSEAVQTLNIKNVMTSTQVDAGKTTGRNRVCILCAATGSSDKNTVSITGFAPMILEFSGVDILKIHPSPTSCSACYRQLRMVDNFKTQIIYTNRLINTTNLLGEFRADGDLTSGALQSTLDTERTNPINPIESSDRDTELPIEQNRGAVLDLDTTEIQIVKIESILSKDLSKKPKVKVKPKGKSTEKFICPECGKQFPNVRKLSRHKYVHEDGQYLCHVCGSVFFYELNLKRHLRSHTGEKPFACSYCDRKFSLRWNMHQHKRLHTNDLPYRCKLCPNAYRHNVTLKKHIAKSHSALECAMAAARGSATDPDHTAPNIKNKMNNKTI